MDAQLFSAIESELRAGNACMLATILERVGSAPRGVGTGMVVTLTGEQTGTVGGGSLEFRTRQDAIVLLKDGVSAVTRYEIHTDDKTAYSGTVTILFRPFAGEAGLALAQQIREALESGETAFLVCQIFGECAKETRVVRAETLCSSCGLDSPPEDPLFTKAESSWLIEPLKPASRVVLFGGGHVAQCMARQLDLLEYRVWVVEDRAAFASETLFPSAGRVLWCDYDDAEPQLNLTKRDHAIVMSRGHETDYIILRWLLRSPADYIGCIGSRRKIALTKERLLSEGLSREQIDRLHAPVGLAIGAQTPAEIAVSVAAELIQHCAKVEPIQKY